MKTLAADVDVVANAREAKTTNPERDTFLARAPSSGRTEMSGEARSSSPRTAWGAFGRLTRHQSWTARICGPSQVADLDGNRASYSRLRSCETRSAMGVVWPLSH